MKFGVHTGPQNCTYDDLRRAWRMADENGFEWLSVWGGAGAEWIIVALRAPFDWESYELFIDRVLPAFR
jgi:hypothetical protein